MNGFFSKLSRNARAALGEGGRNADRDWKLIVSSFLVVDAIVVALSVQLFLSTKADAGVQASDAIPPRVENVDMKGLNALIGEFQSRADSFEAHKAAKPDIQDPSV